MSSRTTRFTEDEINELISKLQVLLPDSSSRWNTRVSVSDVLKETCNYIKKLHKDIDGLSKRLSELLTSRDINVIEVDILTSLLRQ